MNRRRLLGTLVLMLWSATVTAITQIDFAIEQSLFADLQAENLQLNVALTADGLALQGQADSVQLPEPFGTITAIRLQCAEFKIGAAFFSCEKGVMSFSHPQLPQQDLNFSVTAYPGDQVYLVSLESLQLGDGVWTIATEFRGEHWQISADSAVFDLQAVNELIQFFVPAANLGVMKDWSVSASGQGEIHAQGTGSQVQMVKADIQLNALDFSSPDGLYVAESINATVHLDAVYSQSWQWQQHIQIHAGQSYLHPVFTDFDAAPISIHSQGEWRPGKLQIEQFQVSQDGVLDLEGQLRLADMQLQSLQLALASENLQPAWQAWVKPFLTGSFLADLNWQGELAATIDWHEADYHIQVDLQGVDIVDPQQRFAINQLTGHAGWTTRETLIPIDLTWQQLHLGRIPIDQAQVQAEAVDRSLKLLSSIRLPIFDGSLRINYFDLMQTEAGLQWQFDGLLTPISMSQISLALGWPELDGKLSGIIPQVRYAQERIQVEGALQISVFDGTVIIRDLLMLSPFGSLPLAQANLDIHQLDLQLITQTFDFGRITGRVDGFVHDLRLTGWQPVQFDAALHSPSDRKDRRRISQRAVDNLTQIGGGVGGALSRSFMRFFEDFSYEKLGLSCRLQNEVCLMDGIEAAEQGYYIVKGGGGLPPWINVMGFNEQVDWSELISRLQAVKDSEGPVIE